MTKKFKDHAVNPLDEQTDLEMATAETYELDIPEQNKIVARGVDIFEIWPDARQPRRAIPAMMRGVWKGEPEMVAAMLKQWHKGAQTQLNAAIPMRSLLDGEVDAIDIDRD